MSKREHYRRAKEHLESGDDDRLIYAALELRLCLEDIVYSKLKTYASRLPASVKKKWQPPQALKALLQLEPNADEDFTLRMARETELGVPGEKWQHMGTHRTVKYKWVQKHYNKLGSYLHEDQPFVTPRLPYPVRLEKMRAALSRMLEELGPVVASSMDAGLAINVEFDCLACGQKVVCNDDGLQESGKAICLDPDCGAEHEAERTEDGEEWIVKIPETRVVCQNCREAMYIQNRLIRIGQVIKCSNCESKYRLGWAYSPIAEKGGGEETG